MKSATPEEGLSAPAVPPAPDAAGPSVIPYRFVAWNFCVIVFDVAFWMAGIACMDLGAVLPVFVSTLTRSKLLIAFLGMLPGVCWALPQLLGATRVMHRPRKKGFLLAAAAIGRTPMLALPLLLLLFPPQSKAVMLWTLMGCYGILFLYSANTHRQARTTTCTRSVRRMGPAFCSPRLIAAPSVGVDHP